ncbi:type 4a pilus biogenesis protein PilO [Deltaproteobacteria bacterium TL4]
MEWKPVSSVDWSHPSTKGWVLMILVFAFIGSLIYNVQLRPMILHEQLLSSQLQEARGKLREIDQYQKFQTRFEKQSIEMEERLKKIEEALPLTWNFALLNQYLYQAIDTSGMLLIKQVFLPESEFEHYAEIKIHQELSGSYQQLLTLVSAMKQLPIMVNIRKLEVENPILKQQQPPLHVSIQLSVYRRLPFEMKAPPQKG